MEKFTYIFLCFLLYVSAVFPQNDDGFQIARLKYDGGGDWYNDPSSEVNLLDFVNKHTTIKVKSEYVFVDLDGNDIYSYPLLFVTGHGNITFSDSQIQKLRAYLERGGFIYIDDDYGIDKSIRREIKKMFPENDFVEIPFDHEIYHNVFEFNYGPPKIHEHDNKPPQGFGLFLNERLAIYYTYESNPSDGWADPEVHKNPPEIRETALKFGTNLIVYALTN
ncbi:MAG: DUF4159 domain-containing protein [Melioribacteraceae bacterium]|nr:DUF4159 domain-containing protein [Melioribacteraceae bacterium]MCO6473201.1 DUF4159 domain-containing protein [Melioribacteraceae bacterium]MDD3559107.1 DUF4159 domain-containing protein [Melioribacteraceae bacterium]